MLQEITIWQLEGVRFVGSPLLLPASLNGASVLMMPNTSNERTEVIFKFTGSGRCMVSLEPEAETICCSFVPANWPRIA